MCPDIVGEGRALPDRHRHLPSSRPPLYSCHPRSSGLFRSHLRDRSLPADFPFSTFSHPRAHRHWLPTNALGKGTYSDFAARSKALARSASLPPHRRATSSVIQSFAACLVCVPTSVFFLIPPRPHASQIGPHSSWRLRLTSLKVFHETFPTSPAHSSVPMATQVNSTSLSYRQIPDCFPYYSRLFFSTGH